MVWIIPDCGLKKEEVTCRSTRRKERKRKLLSINAEISALVILVFQRPWSQED
jgi:hypothetical protein